MFEKNKYKYKIICMKKYKSMNKFKYVISLIFCIVLLASGFTLVGCAKNKVSFTFVNEGVATFNFDKKKYKVGDTANFTVQLNEKYNGSNIKVYANNIELVNYDGTYCYKLETNKITFEIKGYTVKTYSYNLVTNDFNLYHMSEDFIEHGSNFSFYIGSDKYLPEYTVKVNNEIVTPVNEEYTVYNVKQNLVITVENYTIKSFNVNYRLCEGVTIEFENPTISTTNKVNYGEDIKFKVLYNQGYKRSDNFKVVANFIELQSNNGYTISAVTSDVNIVVEGATKIVNSVNIETGEGIYVIGADTVVYGSDYYLDIFCSEGYDFASDCAVLVNGINIYEAGKVDYVIRNVTTNLEIVVTGTKIKEFTPIFVGAQGLDIVSNNTVEYGSDFTFSYTLKDYYEYLDNFDVLLNGISIFKEGVNEHTVANVKNDFTITFVGVSLVKYNISYTLNIENSCQVNLADNIVEHGDNFIFTISANEGYDISNVVVTVNGNVINRGYAGIYSVENVTEHQVISITGIVSNTPSVVEFTPVFEGVTGVNIVANSTVEYGNNFTFSYTLKDNYEALADFDILVNGESIYQTGITEYTIENVTEDITITFVGVSIVKYTVTHTVNIESSCEVSISNDLVVHGSSYTIEITPNENYDFSEMVVTVNGNVVNSDGNYVYTVNNVTENQVVAITGIKEIVVTPTSFSILSVPVGLVCEIEVDGEIYYDINEIELTADSEIYLLVYEDVGYVLTDSLALFTNTGVIEELEAQYYLITGIESDLQITATGVYPENVHVVKYESSSDYELQFVDGKEYYEEGDYVSFTINLTDSSKTVSVLLNGSPLADVSGIYTFEVLDSFDIEIVLQIIVE